MGFGLLFLGYVTANILSLNILGGVFSSVGYAVIFFASLKLKQYNKSFWLLLVTAVIMTLLSLLTALSDVSGLLYRYLLIPTPIVSEGMTVILNNIRPFFDLFFTVILCICIRNIAKETGAEKIVYSSLRNLVFFFISFALQILVWLSGRLNNQALLEFVTGTALPIWSMIIYILCVLLNSVMIFSCYSKICDANDLEMPQKPSRFAFVNRRRAEKEKQRQKYIEEAIKYTEEQQRRVAEGDKRKRKHKK